MKQIALLILTFFCLNETVAQDSWSKTDIRLGIGTSLLGSGDMRTLMLENEFNQQLSPLLAASLGLGIARSNSGVFETASFFQTNANIYLSPFKNDRRNDFRIGTGLSYYWASDAFVQSRQFDAGQVISENVIFDQRNSLGVNIIIENTYLISEKFLLGLKLLSQPYFNGDINSGVLLKFGFRI
jgi:hypothetical protein